MLVTLNRAGEDGQEFSLEDTTINALAGSDPNLQDAILNGLMKTKRSNVDGQDYIQYDIEAGIYYGVKATVDSTGRLFALIISARTTCTKERATYEKNARFVPNVHLRHDEVNEMWTRVSAKSVFM